MRYTKYFLRTLKESPADETARNADLLIRGGFIHKEMAGVYSFLPLGLRVLNKIADIVREEMNAIGCSELLLSALCPKEKWTTTGRWDEVDVLYKVPAAGGKEIVLSPTHEEVITPLVQHYLQSPKDFPVCVYQIQTKFRNEVRAKSGILRGREFLMKDAYSFHLTQEDFDQFYDLMKVAYTKVYDRLAIGDITKIVKASGGDFSEFSHEFQTIHAIGEDELYIDKKTGEAFNKEIVSKADQASDRFEVVAAVEVGNIFPLANKFSKACRFKVDGTEVIMGSYGIGISRVMGILAEVFNDEKGLKWPENVAPFQVYLAPIGKNDAVYEKADVLYDALQAEGVEVLYDDRRNKKTGPGQKFADAELLGIPYLLTISDNTLELDSVELVSRSTGEKEIVKLSDVTDRF